MKVIPIGVVCRSLRFYKHWLRDIAPCSRESVTPLVLGSSTEGIKVSTLLYLDDLANKPMTLRDLNWLQELPYINVRKL